MQGRNEALNAIVKGKPIPKPGTPESFKVLMRELQSLGLDIGVHKVELSSEGIVKEIEIDLMSYSNKCTSLPDNITYVNSIDIDNSMLVNQDKYKDIDISNLN